MKTTEIRTSGERIQYNGLDIMKAGTFLIKSGIPLGTGIAFFYEDERRGYASLSQEASRLPLQIILKRKEFQDAYRREREQILGD